MTQFAHDPIRTLASRITKSYNPILWDCLVSRLIAGVDTHGKEWRCDMGFRDDFINGYLMTPVGPRQRNFAQWSLENTIDSGFRTNNKQAQAASQHLASAFQSGIQHLADSQMQAAKLLQRELQYQMDGLVGTTERGFADVVSAIQSTCDYLGGQLCEVRWAIESQTKISQHLLQVMLASLDNTSRQYYEQGVKWYEDSEYDLAKERLQLALKDNSRNYFAYQYLGFIAVNREESQGALRNFELARKAAENEYHKALALSHLARSYNAVGELPKALQCSTAATQAAPDHAKFWYECAIYYVRSGNAAEAVKCLRRAISTDWMYWSISVTDSNLEPIRRPAQELLEAMREEQRTVARKGLDQFKQTLTTLGGMQVSSEVEEQARMLSQCETQYREGTVFAYRAAVPIALEAQKKALETAIKVLDQRVAANRQTLASIGPDLRRDLGTIQSQISSLEREADRIAESFHLGCVGWGIVIFISMSMFASLANQGRNVGGGVAVLIGIPALIGLGGKLLIATLPAGAKRSEAARKREYLQRRQTEIDGRIAEETAKLNSGLDILNNHKRVCQERLQGLQR